MSPRPTRQTPEGRAYLDVQNLARRLGRPTDELHQLYALEGFVDRLTRSPTAACFVLKGALLLTAYDSRRPTRDIDLATRALANDAEVVRQVVAQIVEIDVDDGLTFDAAAIQAETIRDGDLYSGVRVTVDGDLSVARVRFHVDISVGDPIVPPPSRVVLPRLLGGELRLLGYPLEMVLAEKVVTAVQRGQANTRWRDFVDVARIVSAHAVNGDQLTASIQRVAEHRRVELAPLADVLDGFAGIAQDRWARWRRKLLLEHSTPSSFSELLPKVVSFADPVIRGEVAHHRWDPTSATWTP